MSIARWSPMKELEEMRREMQNMFGDFLVPAARRWGGRPPEAGAAAPAVQMYGDKDQIVLKAELPGVEKEDIDLTITDDAVTLRGEKKKEAEVKEEDRYVDERSYGRFARTIPLPVGVESDKARASFKGGVLTIVLPKKEEEKARPVKVRVA
jgi:HSP20 family protein